jgi:hypothetical protein
MVKDGKFIGKDGSIPEGQGIVMANLNECHELLEMVRHILALAIVRWPDNLMPGLQLKELMEEDEEEEEEEEEEDGSESYEQISGGPPDSDEDEEETS